MARAPSPTFRRRSPPDPVERPSCWRLRASYDFGPSGVIGDPTPATLEQGQGLLESLAVSWAQAISEIHRMEWVVRHEPSWGKHHWNGFVQSTPSSSVAE